jgi:hypothetical protein
MKFVRELGRGTDTATVGPLLEELHNPSDPFHAGRQELGFSSERFAPLEVVPSEEVEEEAAVSTGTHHDFLAN